MFSSILIMLLFKYSKKNVLIAIKNKLQTQMIKTVCISQAFKSI